MMISDQCQDDDTGEFGATTNKRGNVPVGGRSVLQASDRGRRFRKGGSPISTFSDDSNVRTVRISSGSGSIEPWNRATVRASSGFRARLGRDEQEQPRLGAPTRASPSIRRRGGPGATCKAMQA